jgi:hypothetical protein
MDNREAIARIIDDALVGVVERADLIWSRPGGRSNLALACADAILSLKATTGSGERDRLSGNRAAFEVGAEISKNGPSAELMRVVGLALENECPAPRPVQGKP